MMRRRHLLAIALVLLTLPALARDLNVAIGVRSPLELRQFSMAGSSPISSLGEVNRFNEALAREICQRLAFRCRIHYVTFAEILPGVEGQRFQMGFGNFLRTPERASRVGFSDALWRSSSRLVSTPETLRKFQSGSSQELNLETLANARVATITASQQHRYLEQIAPQRGLTIVTLTTPAEVFEALREQTADFALVVGLSAYMYIKAEDPQLRRFSYVGAGITEHNLGGSVHIALPLSAHALRRDVNRAIADMRNDGTYNRITMQYLPFNPD